MKEKLLAIKHELLSFTRAEKLFIFCAMLCSFLICADYAIIRPVSNSLFIHSYGAGIFPYAWLTCVPLNFLIVWLYNRFLPRIGCVQMFIIIAASIGAGNVFCALFLKNCHFLPFIFYVWKEIYILLLFQQLWSVIHSTIDLKRAKYLYGILFAVGGTGGALGSLVPGFMAVNIGSENLLFLSMPIMAILVYFYRHLLKNSSIKPQQKSTEIKQLASGFKLIKNSRFLIFILLLVVFMQMAATIVDFQFNSSLEKWISEKDLRTEYTGRILAIVNFCTIFLQIFGTYLLVQFLGLRFSHLLVPAVLCLNSCAFLVFPLFGMISISYVTIKALDFSIFTVIKEMLYIPLNTDEKFRAKAFIDVFAYRSSKAVASFFILFLQMFASIQIVPFLTWGCIVLFAAWLLCVFKLFKNYDYEAPRNSRQSAAE